jgi:class 3 adenylate cyclase
VDPNPGDRLRRRRAAVISERALWSQNASTLTGCDVAGYSRLMGADEEDTLAAQRSFRESCSGIPPRRPHQTGLSK